MVENCLKSVLGADLCNWSCLMNDFFKKQEPDPHLHLHCRPRFKNPVTINGNEYVDEEFGHHYAQHKSVKLSEEDKESLFEILKKHWGI
jgi:diadenosine tetraphosphate (Ap4A) HIT family hydrolase